MNFATTHRRSLPVRAYFLLLAALALLTSPAQVSAQPVPKKIGTIEGITEYHLDNGARVLLFPDASSSTVTVNLTVLVGSRHEGYGETGMAHLLEHMLFKGSSKFITPFKALQSRADFNGTTSLDRTNYYETMPATDDNLKFALELEADRLVHSFIKREDLKLEMPVVRNEFEQGENSPSYMLYQRMMAVAYEWHNYGKATIGNRTDIERVPIEQLQVFYRKYYQPDNIVLTVAGKFDENKALEYITKTFAAIPKPKRVLDKTYTEEPDQDGERTVTLRRVGGVPLVGLVYHIPAAAHADYAPLYILSSVLGSTPSGRLYKGLVETKKATDVSGSAVGQYDPGVLSLSATVAEGVKAEAVRDLMIDLVEQLKDNPVTQEEVDRARRAFQAAFERAFAKSTTIALELSEWIAFGDWRLLFLHRDRINQVTPQDVMRVAEAYLKQTNRTTGLYLPSKEVVRAKIPQTPSIVDLVKDYKGSKTSTVIAAGEHFDPTPANVEKRLKRSTLPGGVKVAVLQKKTRGETVILDLTLRFGNEKSLTGQKLVADFVGPLLMMGTKKYTQEQLADELDKLKATLNTDTNLGTLSVSIEARRDTLPKVLDLLREVLREPTFPQEQFDILQRSYKQQLEKALNDPSTLASNTLRRKVNPYPPDSIHYQPTIKELIGLVEGVTRERVQKLYREQLGGIVGELVIVGDFDTQTALKQLSAMLDNWKSPVVYERIRRLPNLKVPGSREDIFTPDKENAVYLAGYQFKLTDASGDYLALSLGNYILGGGSPSRLWDRLRVQDGSYSVSSSLRVSSLPDGLSSFGISATCNPANIDKADKGAQEELQRLLKEGVTAEELQLAIKAYLQELKVARAEDANLATMLAGALYLGRTELYYAEQERRIAQLTVEQVNAALRAHLQPARLVIVRAGDFKKKAETPKK